VFGERIPRRIFAGLMAKDPQDLKGALSFDDAVLSSAD
jgi:hypothetical protein